MTMAMDSDAEARTRFAAIRQAWAEAAWLAKQVYGTPQSDIDTDIGEEWPPGNRPQERHRRICERAYYKALQRGFAPGSELRDWLEAESEVDSGLPPRRLD
jgi:hypothetical protein